MNYNVSKGIDPHDNKRILSVCCLEKKYLFIMYSLILVNQDNQNRTNPLFTLSVNLVTVTTKTLLIRFRYKLRSLNA